MSASNSPLLANPKPEPRRVVKARADRQHDKARELCRLVVFTRAGGCCQRCGRPLVLHLRQGDWWNVANINEIKPRSLGGDPTDPMNCSCLCANCHTGKGFHDHA